MKNLLIICVISFYYLCNPSYAQDLHFSQFYQTPMLMNPALTGAFNGDHRVILNHKDQWNAMAVSGPAFRTSMLSFDASLLKKKFKKAHLGAGFYAFRDMAGDIKFGTTQLNFNVSSIITVSDHNKVSAGLQGGFAQRAISQQDLKWGSQYNASTGSFDPANNPSNETNAFEPYMFGDFSMGLAWSYAIEESAMLSNNDLKTNLGVSIFHINAPEQKINSSPLNIEKLYRKIIFHGGAQVGIGRTNFDVLPSFMYMMQGPSKELNVGAFIRWTIKEESKYTGMFKETALSIGGYWRKQDAFIPSMMFEYANFALGVTYDVNISDLRVASQSKGGIELSLRYITPNPFKSTSKSVRFL